MQLLIFDHIQLSPAVLEEFTASVHKAGAPLDCCFGFIDRTMRPVARPKFGQHAIYSGHYKTHGFKFQSVLTPDGLISDLQGPYAGRTHDLTMLRNLGLYDVLEAHARTSHGTPLAIYGDPAYTLTCHLLMPF